MVPGLFWQYYLTLGDDYNGGFWMMMPSISFCPSTPETIPG